MLGKSLIAVLLLVVGCDDVPAADTESPPPVETDTAAGCCVTCTEDQIACGDVCVTLDPTWSTRERMQVERACERDVGCACSE